MTNCADMSMCVTVQREGEMFQWHIFNRGMSFLECNLDNNLPFTKYIYLFMETYLYKVEWDDFYIAQKKKNGWLTIG